TLVFGSGSATLNVNWIGAGSPQNGVYTLFTYTGADPTLPTWTYNLGSGITDALVTLDVANNRVLLTVGAVPEPRTWAMLALGGVLAFGAIRRLRPASGRSLV